LIPTIEPGSFLHLALVVSVCCLAGWLGSRLGYARGIEHGACSMAAQLYAASSRDGIDHERFRAWVIAEVSMDDVDRLQAHPQAGQPPPTPGHTPQAKRADPPDPPQSAHQPPSDQPPAS